MNIIKSLLVVCASSLIANAATTETFSVSVPANGNQPAITNNVLAVIPSTLSPGRSHPVLMLLHGAGDNETAWNTQGSDLNALAEKHGRVILCPTAGPYSWFNSNNNSEQFLLAVITAAEARYPLTSDRWIAGFSMGGYGTLRMFANYPQTFSGAAALSPCTKPSLWGNDWEIPAAFGPSVSTGAEDTFTPAWLNKLKNDNRPLVMVCGNSDTFFSEYTQAVAAAANSNTPIITYPTVGGHTWAYSVTQLQATLDRLAAAKAKTLDLYLLTGQSNSLGVIQNSVLNNSPFLGSHAAEQFNNGKPNVPFWYNNFGAYKSPLGTISSTWSNLTIQPKGFLPYGVWGPEMGISRTMYDKGRRNFAIVKASRTGGGNTKWQSTATPPSVGASGPGEAYWSIIDAITASTTTTALRSMGYTDFRIAGLSYLQGESNNMTEANEAPTRFNQLVDDLKARYPSKTLDMKTVLGENLQSACDRTYGLNTYTNQFPNPGQEGSGAKVTNTNLAALAASDVSKYGWVPTSDAIICNTDALKIHADANSMLKIGNRFAGELLRLEANSAKLDSSGSMVAAETDNSNAAGYATVTTASQVVKNDLINAAQGSLSSATWDKQPGFETNSLNNGYGHPIDTYSGCYLRTNFPATYTVELNSASKPNGYAISEIRSFAGWSNNGATLANQKYELLVKTVTNPTYVSYGVYEYTPFQSADTREVASTKMVLKSKIANTPLATGVTGLKFVFMDHGQMSPTYVTPGSVYHELDVIEAADNGPSTNTAVIPVPRLEMDAYDWYQRHSNILALQGTMNPEIVMIGDSITHTWGGTPSDAISRGPISWQKTFGNRSVLNMGFGWDRTQNVLWRLANGQLSGVNPKYVVLNIGTNNLTGTGNAITNTPAEITAGIDEILKVIQQKVPNAKIILMGVFPRGFSVSDPFRAKIQSINSILQTNYTGHPKITFLNIYSNFLQADGNLSSVIMADGVHPSEAGYEIWSRALIPHILGENTATGINTYKATDNSAAAGYATAATYSSSILNNDLINAGQSSFTSAIWDKTPGFETDPINNGVGATTSAWSGTYLPKVINGSNLFPVSYTVSLNTAIATRGYNIREIRSFAGFCANGAALGNQKYELLLKKVGSTSFISKGIFTYSPFAASDTTQASATKMIVSNSSGLIESEVDAVRFVFLDHGMTAPGNPVEGTVYQEIDVLGEAVPNASFADWSVSQGIADDKIADLDGDNIPNLMEYALGFNPKQRNLMPVLQKNNNVFQLTWPKGATAAADTSLSYQVQISTDLQTWTNAPASSISQSSASISINLPSQQRVFTRLNVTKTP